MATILGRDYMMTTTPAAAGPRRALDPQDRIAETLFGLIMVLTFTGSLSVAESNSNDVRVMLIGALGCNFAWAVIDALFYLMSSLSERSGLLRTWHAVRDLDPAQHPESLASAWLALRSALNLSMRGSRLNRLRRVADSQ